MTRRARLERFRGEMRIRLSQARPATRRPNPRGRPPVLLRHRFWTRRRSSPRARIGERRRSLSARARGAKPSSATCFARARRAARRTTKPSRFATATATTTTNPERRTTRRGPSRVPCHRKTITRRLLLLPSPGSSDRGRACATAWCASSSPTCGTRPSRRTRSSQTRWLACWTSRSPSWRTARAARTSPSCCSRPRP